MHPSALRRSRRLRPPTAPARRPLHRLVKDWSETAATWNQRMAGVAWQTAGASGAGTDYASVADASGSGSFDPGWITFNVTNSVAAMSNEQPGANFGWRLRATNGIGQLKRLYSSDYTASPALRPKLVVTYE